MMKDVICFSHLRWNFVYQRPQHLLSRLAAHGRVFYIEEPIFDADEAYFDLSDAETPNIWVVVPHLPAGLPAEEINEKQRSIVDALIVAKHISNYMLWFYSPMAFQFADHLHPDFVVYDCMDELSAFKNAPALLIENETKLMQVADIVFTGGQSLYRAKKDKHPNIHAMPSAIDKNDFFPARSKHKDPEDQINIPYPRLGFYGVIDERFNLELVDKLATLRPDWHFVFIGPVVKIDEGSLPRRENIHYLGGKNYRELPVYVSNWDICIMPFALNESTRFISPTKTPEFLAAGKPVISTSITDVIDPYGIKKLVHIKDDPEGFIEAAEQELQTTDKSEWLGRVDHFLSGISWDKTFEKMQHLIKLSIENKKINKPLKMDAYV